MSAAESEFEWRGISAHPLATFFPMMPESEIAELADDIARRGLENPIVLYEGQVLDGRNRLAALDKLGISPSHIAVFKGDDPLGFVLSQNLRRRHLTESQRALIASALATLRQGCRPATSADLPTWKAAKMLMVSERVVRMARKIRDEADPQVIAEIAAGRLSIHKATKLLSLPFHSQMKALKGGKQKTDHRPARLTFCRDVAALTWADLIGFRNQLSADLNKVDALIGNRVVADATMLVSDVLPAATLMKLIGGADGKH